MASGEFRSNSSALTNLYVNIYEIWRSGTSVGMRVEWQVTTGSGSSLGNNTGNWRNLIITHVNGTVLTQAEIKSASATWNASSTYSGSWDFSFDTGAYAANTQSMIPSTNATGTSSCIWTTYVSQLDVAVSETWTAIGTPAITSISPVIFETVVNLSWNAAANGNNNAVSSYRVYYNLNGGAFSYVDVGLALSYSLPIVGVARGTTMSFYIVAMDSQGSSTSTSVYSGYTMNRTPYLPTSPSVPKTSYLPGETVVVSFSNNGDADGNLAGFEVATNADETIVGTGGSGATSVSVSTIDWAQGIQRAFRVRAYDAYGIRSAWSAYTATVTFNTAPNAPVINFPVQGSTTYNRRPHILLTAGVTNDGPYHVLCLNDGTEHRTDYNGGSFSCGGSNQLASGQKLIYVPPSDYAVGGAGYSAYMFDGYLASAAPSRNHSVSVLSLTDTDISTTGMQIKAVHITQLQAAINVLRAAYGLAAYSFTACVAGTSFVGNAGYITELQAALQAVLTAINGWDTSSSTFDIAVTWVDPSAVGGGVDRVKLRQAIEQLRTTIQLI